MYIANFWIYVRIVQKHQNKLHNNKYYGIYNFYLLKIKVIILWFLTLNVDFTLVTNNY